MGFSGHSLFSPGAAPPGTWPVLIILRPQCGFHRHAGLGAPDEEEQDECSPGISISTCFPGPYVGWWLAELSDSCLTKPGARTQKEQLLPSALCPLPSAGPRASRGNRGLLAHLVPRAGALSQSSLSSSNPLPGCAARGKCTPSLCPASRLH